MKAKTDAALRTYREYLSRPPEERESSYHIQADLTPDVWQALSEPEKSILYEVLDYEFLPPDAIAMLTEWHQRTQKAEEAFAEKQQAEQAAALAEKAAAVAVERLRRDAETLGLPEGTDRQTVDRAKAERAAERQRRQNEQERIDRVVKAALTLDPVSTVPSLFRRSDGQGLIYPGRTHSIAGESESGKTWIALAIAREFIEDHEPYPPEVRRATGYAGPCVYYADYDSDRTSIEGRMVALGLDDDRFIYAEAPASLDDCPDSVGLVVIDNVTAAMAAGGYSGTNEHVSAWFSAVPQMLAAKGITVVMLDHLTKANDGTGRYAIGGVQKLAALSGCQYIVDVLKPLLPGSVGQIELRVTKDRQGQVRAASSNYRAYDRSARTALFILDAEVPEELEIRLDPPEVKKHVSAVAKDTLDESLRTYIEEHPGCSLRDLLSVNKNYTTLKASTQRLIGTGVIRIEPGPRGSHLHYLTVSSVD